MSERQLEATHEYRDEKGVLVYQKLRFKNPKDFAVRRLVPYVGGAGKWVYNLDGVEPLLYQLPTLLDQATKSQHVLIVEGEKKVDLLRSLGFVSTTSGSADSWRPQFGQWLRGRRCVILPDNNEAGERYARSVAGSLIDWSVASLRIVRLIGVPRDGDVADWMEGLGGITEKQKKAALIEQILKSSEYCLVRADNAA